MKQKDKIEDYDYNEEDDRQTFIKRNETKG